MACKVLFHKAISTHTLCVGSSIAPLLCQSTTAAVQVSALSVKYKELAEPALIYAAGAARFDDFTILEDPSSSFSHRLALVLIE